MSKTGDAAIDRSDEAIEQALTDHHLDEVAEMIDQARAEKASSASPFGDSPAGYLRGS